MSREYVSMFPAFCTPKTRSRCLDAYTKEGGKAILRAFLLGLDWEASSSLVDLYYAERILINEQPHLKKRDDAKDIDMAFAHCIQLIMRTIFVTCDRDTKASEFHFTKKEIRAFEDAVDLFDTLTTWVRTIDVVNAVFKAEDRRSAPKQSSYSLALMGELNYRLTKQWTRKESPIELGLEFSKC